MKQPNAYDPDSLLTGEEAAKGMRYDNSDRVPCVSSFAEAQAVRKRAAAGEIAPTQILNVMPRMWVYRF